MVVLTTYETPASCSGMRKPYHTSTWCDGMREPYETPACCDGIEDLEDSSLLLRYERALQDTSLLSRYERALQNASLLWWWYKRKILQDNSLLWWYEKKSYKTPAYCGGMAECNMYRGFSSMFTQTRRAQDRSRLLFCNFIPLVASTSQHAIVAHPPISMLL